MMPWPARSATWWAWTRVSSPWTAASRAPSPRRSIMRSRSRCLPCAARAMRTIRIRSMLQIGSEEFLAHDVRIEPANDAVHLVLLKPAGQVLAPFHAIRNAMYARQRHCAAARHDRRGAARAQRNAADRQAGGRRPAHRRRPVRRADRRGRQRGIPQAGRHAECHAAARGRTRGAHQAPGLSRRADRAAEPGAGGRRARPHADGSRRRIMRDRDGDSPQQSAGAQCVPGAWNCRRSAPPDRQEGS